MSAVALICSLGIVQAGENVVWEFDAGRLAAGGGDLGLPEANSATSVTGPSTTMAFSVSRDDLVKLQRIEDTDLTALRVLLPFPSGDIPATAASVGISNPVYYPGLPLQIELKFRWSGGPVSISTLARFSVEGTILLLPLGGFSGNLQTPGYYLLPAPAAASGTAIPPDTIVTLTYVLQDTANGLSLQTRIEIPGDVVLDEQLQPEVPAPMADGASGASPQLSLADLKVLSLTFSLNHQGDGAESVDVVSFRATQ